MISVPHEPHIINVIPKIYWLEFQRWLELTCLLQSDIEMLISHFMFNQKFFLSSTPQSRDVLRVGPWQDLVMFVTLHQFIVFIIISVNHVEFRIKSMSLWFSWIFEALTCNSIMRGPTILHNFRIMFMNRSVLTDNQLKHPLASR